MSTERGEKEETKPILWCIDSLSCCVIVCANKATSTAEYVCLCVPTMARYNRQTHMPSTRLCLYTPWCRREKWRRGSTSTLLSFTVVFEFGVSTIPRSFFSLAPYHFFRRLVCVCVKCCSPFSFPISILLMERLGFNIHSVHQQSLKENMVSSPVWKDSSLSRNSKT